MSQDILTAISDAVGTEVFGIWFLIGISGIAWINSFFLKKIFQNVKIRKDV